MEEPKEPRLTAHEESSPQAEELENKIAELIAEALHNLIKKGQGPAQNTANIDKNI